MPVVLKGLRELNGALRYADKQVRLGVRKAERDIAEPVKQTAESLARARIPRIGPKWYRMRIGITRILVYVAPRQRGARGRDNRRRRGQQFAGLLMGRAMEPALERHAPELEHEVERFLDRIADDFNAGGVR